MYTCDGSRKVGKKWGYVTCVQLVSHLLSNYTF